MQVHEIEAKPSKVSIMFWAILGFVCCIITLTIMFNTHYVQFFERKLYLTRKNLVSYLRENGVPEYEKPPLAAYQWNLGRLRLFLWNCDLGVSLHDESRALNTCILCPYHKGIADTRNYHAIKDILIKNVLEVNHESP